MPKIFVSHSSQDRAVAEHVAGYLERRGMPCWYTPRDVKSGQDWDQAILEASQDCSAMLLIFSGNADESVHVRRELDLADRAKKFLLTLRVEEVQPRQLAYFLNLSQWIDWMDKRDETLERVYRTLSQLDGKGAQAASAGRPAREQTVSIPAGQKLWLRPGKRGFVPAPVAAREKRVLSSARQNKNAVGYLRMRAVDNGRYDTHHEVVRRDDSVYGYFTDGFREVAYTYGFVSPEDYDVLYVLNERFRASKSTLSVIRPEGRVWLKLAVKFSVTKRHVLNFSIMLGELLEFNFRDERQQFLFCLNTSGFFFFDRMNDTMLANIAFEQGYLDKRQVALSPVAPLVAVALCQFDRKGTLDDRDIYTSIVQIYHIETGEKLMEFPLSGNEPVTMGVAFSQDGRSLCVTAGEREELFDLIEVG